MSLRETIFCVECNKEVIAVRVTGDIIYPHRRDLHLKRFFKCLDCDNYVGTHRDSGKPLGVIPSKELRKQRMKIHELIDPVWKNGTMKRGEMYQKIKEFLGYEFHTAEIDSMEKAKDIFETLRSKLFCLEENK